MKKPEPHIQNCSRLSNRLIGVSLLTTVGMMVSIGILRTSPVRSAPRNALQLTPIGTVDWSKLPSISPANAKRSYQVQPTLARSPRQYTTLAPQATFIDSDTAVEPSAAATLGRKFEGPASSSTEPPDPSLAVGPSDLMVSTNAGFQVYSKTGVPIGGLKDPSAFFLVPASYKIQSDPKFIYDKPSDRFFGVWIGYSAANKVGSWFVAVSTSNSAAGSFFIYRLDEAGQLPDYPGLGVCNDKLVVTANNFANAKGFSDAAAGVFNKSQILTGGSTFFQIFRNIKTGGVDAFTVQPATSLSSTKTCHMISLGKTNHLVQLYQITGLPTASSSPKLTVGQTVSMTAVSQPPVSVQQGTNKKIDSGDTRLLGAVYRDGKLWTSSVTGCTIKSVLLACANLLEIDKVDSNPAKGRQNILGAAEKFSTFPALSIDKKNNVTLIYSQMGASTFPSLKYTTWRKGANKPEPSITLVRGQASYIGAFTAGTQSDPHRWGDYFGAAADPSNASAIWLTGEFKAAGPAGRWNTMVGQTKIP